MRHLIEKTHHNPDYKSYLELGESIKKKGVYFDDQGR